MDTPNLSPLKPSDKVVGASIVAAAAVAAGTGLYFVLPILIELAKNTLIFGAPVR